MALRLYPNLSIMQQLFTSFCMIMLTGIPAWQPAKQPAMEKLDTAYEYTERENEPHLQAD